MPDPYRATRDVDVLTFGSTDDAAIRALVGEICAVPCPEDGLRFDLTGLTIEDTRGPEQYPGSALAFWPSSALRASEFRWTSDSATRW